MAVAKLLKGQDEHTSKEMNKRLFSSSFSFSLLQSAKYLRPLFFTAELIMYIKIHKFVLVKRKGGTFRGRTPHDNGKYATAEIGLNAIW